MNEMKTAAAQLNITTLFLSHYSSTNCQLHCLFFLVVLHYSHCNYMQKLCNYFDNTNVQIFLSANKVSNWMN